MQFPIWVWVALVVGVIAAGIGLGYLIIYLFWRIDRYFSHEVAVPKKVKPEIKVEEPVPVEEKVVTNIQDAIPSERTRLVKFTYILNSKFYHPFEKADTIICWDLDLKNGDEIWDAGGKQMKLQVTRLKGETERVRYTLADESGHHTVSVIPTKEYLERETKLNSDKVRMIW
ncbi:hypothetical protein ACFLXT_05145 [Chloroflexota bacterium]